MNRYQKMTVHNAEWIAVHRAKVAIEAKRTAIMDNASLTGYTSDGIEITYDGLNFRDEYGHTVYIGGLVKWIDLDAE